MKKIWGFILIAITALVSCGPSGDNSEITVPSTQISEPSDDPTVSPVQNTEQTSTSPSNPSATSQQTAPATSETPSTPEAPSTPSAATAQNPPSTPNLPAKLEGVVTSLRGNVTLHRDGRDSTGELDMGFVLHDFDLISTGNNGRLEANFRGPGLPGASLNVGPNTKVYVEQSLLNGGGTQTTVQLLTGRIGLNVQRLAGSQVGVNTQAAALGVRGTQFDVVIAPQLEVLVTCSTGQVSVVQGGERSSAIPGRAVTANPEDGVAEYSVQVRNIDAFQDKWFSVLLEEFSELAVPLLKTVYRRWDRNLARFQAERAKLNAQNAVLVRWKSAVDSGNVLSIADLVRDKRAVAGVLLNLKKIMFFFERDWAWLATVQKDFPQVSLGEDVGGVTAQEFFALYQNQQRDLGLQFSSVRNAFRLLAAVDPESPLGDFFGEESF